MGRLTELLDYLYNDNSNDYRYTHLTITMKMAQKKAEIKKNKTKK